ncbi:hypothetical protein ASE74_09110 [Pedobacter sp. Leaf216]|nr:hypothetical protein ASE74_09110 [Pedobacter sp. Leaf216]
MQVVLSLFRIKPEERKVRATQGIPLSNGKGFRNENLNYGLVQQKIYRPDFVGVRVKTCGKSARALQATVVVCKPRELKDQIG